MVATDVPFQRELRTAAETATAAPPTFTTPDEIITSLQADLNERDFSDLQAAMRDPFVFALYPAGIRRKRPRTVVDELRFRYLPLNATIAFTETNGMAMLPAGARPVHYVPAQARAGAVTARPSMLRY